MIPQELARTALDQFGLGALGIASGQLAPRWHATANPTWSAGDLSLTFATDWRCPAGGSIAWGPAPHLSGLDGAPLAGTVAVLALHPQAHLRLRRLYVQRYEGRGDDRSARPVLRYVAVRAATTPSPLPGLGVGFPGTPLPAGRVTFHDGRGLILHPLAVAAQFADLIAAWAPLATTGANDGSPGSLTAIALLDGTVPSVLVHVVTPHGAPFRDPGAGSGLRFSGTTRLGGAGPQAWPAGESIAVESVTASPQLRFGLYPEGVLGTAAVTAPAFPGTPVPAGSSAPNLARDFLRLCAVDLAFHLLGNRATVTVDGVTGRDAAAAAELAPIVRDGPLIRLAPDAANPAVPPDGVATLGALQEMLNDVLPPPTSSVFGAVIASPTVRNDFALPVDRTNAGRWPAAPAPAGPAAAWNPTNLGALRTEGATGIGASWNAATGNDIALTVAADILPAGAHVRVFPRRFVTGPSLTEAETLFRGDGDATIVPATGATQLLLRDPLGLGTLPRPSSPRLRFDLLVVPRPLGQAPRARLFGGFNLSVGTGPANLAAAVAGNDLALIPDVMKATCSSPLLGLPPRPGPAFTINDASDVVAIALGLGGETTPREGPRFPTMARFDTIAAFRDENPPAPFRWRALLTGGFLSGETRAGDHRLGNPGAAAGPEVHAIGVEVDGQLAYDLFRAGMRRVHSPIVTDLLRNRLVHLGGGNLDEPAPPAAPTTMAGATLQTIAPFCETPLFAAHPDPAALPDNWNDIQTAINNLLGTGLTVTTTNGDRLVAEVKREFFAAKYGRRDAQWALKRAVAQARELIYIEAPHFGPTAYHTRTSDGKTVPVFAWDRVADGRAPALRDDAWDLVDALRTRLGEQPALKVVIAIPREVAFGAAYATWKQQHYQRRREAIDALRAAAPGRVLAFHPVGFPGRPMNLRTTCVTVDDAWALVGTSAPRRRGLTFDGGQDVVCFDRRLRDGYSVAIRDFRRRLMALLLGEAPAAAGVPPSSGWVRPAQPAAAFNLVRETLDQGGRGLIQPIWGGPPTSGAGAVAVQSDDVADPDGRTVGTLLLWLVSGLSDLET